MRWSAAASSSASAPVPSGDPSSTTRSVAPGAAARMAAAMVPRLSASLYVGRTIQAPLPTGAPGTSAASVRLAGGLETGPGSGPAAEPSRDGVVVIVGPV